MNATQLRSRILLAGGSRNGRIHIMDEAKSLSKRARRAIASFAQPPHDERKIRNTFLRPSVLQFRLVYSSNFGFKNSEYTASNVRMIREE
jgi:hypothetical protein